MIAEYHLTSASQGTHSILPVLPEGAARLMPPVDEYLPGSFEGCRDVRVTDRENHQETAGLTEEGTPFQPAAYLPVGGAPGPGATSAASHGSGSPRRYR